MQHGEKKHLKVKMMLEEIFKARVSTSFGGKNEGENNKKKPALPENVAFWEQWKFKQECPQNCSDSPVDRMFALDQVIFYHSCKNLAQLLDIDTVAWHSDVLDRALYRALLPVMIGMTKIVEYPKTTCMHTQAATTPSTV